MNTVLLIVPVGMEYPPLLSRVDSVGVVGFILTLKGQVFSSICINSPTLGYPLYLDQAECQ